MPNKLPSESAIRKYGERLNRGVNESKGIREPFIKMIAQGEVPQWRGAFALRRVRIDPRGSSSFSSTPDLILLHNQEGLAVVECKRASSREAKHGLFEQVLLYVEMVRQLDRGILAERIQGGKIVLQPEGGNLDALLRSVVIEPTNLLPRSLVVVDRWGNTAAHTAALTLKLFNCALATINRPPIEVWAVGSGKPERVLIDDGRTGA